MRRRPATYVSVLSVTALGMAALATGVSPAVATPPSPAPTSARAAVVTVDDPSGTARTITAAPGAPLARPAGVSSSAGPAEIAKAVVAANATALDARGATFAAKTTLRDAVGGSVVHLQQTVAGVPVLGGEAVVSLDASGATTSASAETLPGAAPGTVPTIPASVATQRALRSVQLSAKAPAGTLLATAPTLAIYDPRIFGADGLQRSSLVWRTTVRSTTDLGVNHLVLVDAAHGVITLDLDQNSDALNRTVCDANRQPAQVPCTAPVRTEGGPDVTPANDDINLAYNYAGITYNFYKNQLGRDSVDNLGLTLKSTVRYCPTTAAADCPYENAFWDGTQMVYGQGFASADDVVAHELTHGVTQYTNGLFYFFQSGAINESLSDIFGEYIDQTDGVDGNGGAYPAKNWVLGEDLPDLHNSSGQVVLPAGSGLRDMADPHKFNQPDRMGDPTYETHGYYDGNAFDNGGVHTNSGVGNKFGYLIGNTRGSTVAFNGHNTTGLGIPVASEIVYGASQLLTSGADYRAFATALRASCAKLVATDGEVTPVSAQDCAQVNNAILATQMDQQPTAVGTTDAATCPAGQVTKTSFVDTMEDPASGNWVPDGTTVTYGSAPTTTTKPLWFFGTDTSNPYGFSNQYATSGTGNYWGDDPDLRPIAGSPFTNQPAQYDASLVLTKPVVIPAGGLLRFEHAFGFDYDAANQINSDGGRVEFTTNNGATWSDLGPYMTGSNGYGFNVPGGAANSRLGLGTVLGDAAAFTRHSQGYVATRANLASLAGKSVRFRFRIVTDQAYGDYGWFIDDVRVYSCSTLLPVSTPPTTVFAPVAIGVGSNDATPKFQLNYKSASAVPGKPLVWSGGKAIPASRVIPVTLPKGGGTTCIQVSAYLAGRLYTTQTRCETLPVDDRSLKRSGSWRSLTNAASYARTLSGSTKKGSTLTLSAARGTRLVIVAEKLKGGGTIGVYVKGRRVATISLASTSARFKQVIDIAVKGLGGGPVVLKVETSGKTVNIDGVGVRP